ncbi:S41 family peptidase [Sphingorhabdus arenilitoris]|uniref:S41 family peptidase n=1 Tax=Sphingorhabdus arenilitoris TaxID=1490041 RepID=A0ABV8REK5_9SPHN
MMLTRRSVVHLGCSAAILGMGGTGQKLFAEAPTNAKTYADDITILREALTALHPGLYRYLSPRQADAGIKALERSFVNAPDLAQRYLALSRFLASIRCGHSYANFYNQSEAVQTELFKRKTRLPFAFQWIESAMVVTADHGSGIALQPGTQVLRINGVPSKKILAALLPYVRADGHNDAKRRALLSISGYEDFETFDVFHGLIYGAPANGMHEIDMLLPAGQRKIAMIPAISYEDRQSYRRSKAVKADEPLWQWDMRPDGIAVLTMNDWGTYNSNWDWRAWLNDRLNTLENARGLIVDIRANEGGEDCGDELIARFAKNNVPLTDEIKLVSYRTTPKAIDPYLDTWDDSFRTLGEGATPHDTRLFALARSQEETRIAPRGPRIVAPMIILTGPQNSSATFRFSSLCKGAGFATLVGEPTGGNQRGINGGRFFFVRLPASGLEFDLPLIGFFPKNRAPDKGIEPDFLVKTKPADIANGRDVIMETALNLLKSK